MRWQTNCEPEYPEAERWRNTFRFLSHKGLIEISYNFCIRFGDSCRLNRIARAPIPPVTLRNEYVCIGRDTTSEHNAFTHEIMIEMRVWASATERFLEFPVLSTTNWVEPLNTFSHTLNTRHFFSFTFPRLTERMRHQSRDTSNKCWCRRCWRWWRWSHLPLPISEECPYRAESARSRAPLHILNVQSGTVNCLSWTHSIDFDAKSSDSSAHKRISRIPFAFFGVCRRQHNNAFEMDILLRRRSSHIEFDCRPFVCVQTTQSYRLLCELHTRYLKPIRSQPAARNRTRLSIGSICVNAFNKCTNSFIVFVFNLYFQSCYFNGICASYATGSTTTQSSFNLLAQQRHHKRLAPLLLLCSHSSAILRKCIRLTEIESSLQIHDPETEQQN